MAVLERWLPNTVTILDMFHCIIVSYVPKKVYNLLNGTTVCFRCG